MSDRVTVTVDQGVAEVRLNRPDKMNALDRDMFEAIAAAGEQLKTAAGVRAVVLSGEGRAFCAGLDFSMFQAMGPPAADAGSGAGSRGGGLMDTDGRITHLGQQVAWVWTELEVPVIAAVHGPCLGGGLQIALGADIRIVAPDATLSILEIRWGIIPDMSGTVSLPALVGVDVAKELVWSGRMVSGEEAVGLGLATRVADDPRAAALELARELSGKNPDAIRAGKRLLARNAPRDAPQQLAMERKEIAALIGRPNQVEAVRAYFEKRAPDFTDPA